MISARNMMVIAAAALAGVLAAALGGCSEEGDQPAGPAPSGPRLEQVFVDHVTVETENGIRKWVLKSDQMQQFAGQDEVLLIDLVMDFYRDGAVFSTLTADSGRADPDNRNVHAWGDVVVVTQDHRRLETEELFYDNETQLITNDVFDRYTWSDGEATGMGMEASPDLDYFEIKRSFQSEIQDQAPDSTGGR